MIHVRNPLAKNQLHNIFNNPLQATKGDQGQDNNDVGIGGSSNNLWMQQSNSTLSFATS